MYVYIIFERPLAILHVHVVGMDLYFNRLHEDGIHVPGFGGEDGDVVSLNAVPQIDTVLHLC
jgi:hypothetical protein